MKYITFKNYLFCLLLLLIGSSVYVHKNVQKEMHKINFIVKDLPSTIVYTPLSKSKGFNMTEKEYREYKSKLFRKPSGFSYSVYELGTIFHPIQIVHKHYSCNEISYLKNRYRTEYYYDENYPVYLYEGLSYRGKYRERRVLDNFAPYEIYQSCWEKVEEELKQNAAKPIKEDRIEERLQTEKWHYFFYKALVETNKRFNQKYVNDYFSVSIYCMQCTFEVALAWPVIFRDIVCYLLILSLLPTILIAIAFFPKSKFLIIWCGVNYLFLSLSVYDSGFNDYSPISMEASKEVWPFTKSIIRMREKSVYEGQDPESKASIVYYTGEKEIGAIVPLSGYDCTEFIAYCLLGYIIHLIFFRKKNDVNVEPQNTNSYELR